MAGKTHLVETESPCRFFLGLYMVGNGWIGLSVVGKLVEKKVYCCGIGIFLFLLGLSLAIALP